MCVEMWPFLPLAGICKNKKILVESKSFSACASRCSPAHCYTQLSCPTLSKKCVIFAPKTFDWIHIRTVQKAADECVTFWRNTHSQADWLVITLFSFLPRQHRDRTETRREVLFPGGDCFWQMHFKSICVNYSISENFINREHPEKGKETFVTFMKPFNLMPWHIFYGWNKSFWKI